MVSHRYENSIRIHIIKGLYALKDIPVTFLFFLMFSRYTIVGLVSAGAFDCGIYVPGVVTDIYGYLWWIKVWVPELV